MKRGYWIVGGVALAAVVVAAVLLLVGPSSGEEEHPATVIETVNIVEAHPRPEEEWRPAIVDMLVYAGGQVRTGAASSARLALREATVRLSAHSMFTVKKSATRQDKLLTTVFLQEGRLWADLTSERPHEFTVESGYAAAVVRDTRFSVQVTAEEMLVSVAEGEVVLTAQEQSVTVAAEEQATVVPGQPPSPPEPMSEEERALWATEGHMPELATPAPTPTLPATPTYTPTPVPTVAPVSTATPMPEPTWTPIPSTSTPAPTPVPTSTPVPPTLTPEPTPTPVPPTPTVPGEVQVNLDDDGRQIDLVTGQILVVILGSNPSTGYEWEVAEGEGTLLLQIGEKEFQRDPEAPADMVGVGGVEVFSFEAVGAGQTTLKLIYHRPWETGVDPVATFTLQVVVR